MLKKKFLMVLMIFTILFSVLIRPVYAIDVPEKDINLKIENLTRGCVVYTLIPEEILKYNMSKFVENNINNTYEVEKLKAQEIQKYMKDEDYEGYVEYFLEQGYTCGANEIELRHYCFCFGESTEYEFVEIDEINYLKIKLHLSDIDTFKIVLKDYFVNYNTDDIKFMVDEYGSITYITLDDVRGLRTNETPHILEYNVLYEHVSKEDFETIERTIDVTYFIIYLILILIVLFIAVYAIKKWKADKEEKEMRLFWKKEVKEKKAIKEAKEAMAKNDFKNFQKELKEKKKEKKQELKKAIKLARLTRKKKKK